MFYCFSVATDVMVENVGLVDCQEGIAAFVEKRKPTWTHQYITVKDLPPAESDK